MASPGRMLPLGCDGSNAYWREPEFVRGDRRCFCIARGQSLQALAYQSGGFPTRPVSGMVKDTGVLYPFSNPCVREPVSVA